MNSLRRHKSLIGKCMFALLAVWQVGQPLQAATYYWDTDGSDVGNSINGTNIGGTGTWDLATSNWWDATNPLTLWPNLNTDTAVFTGTGGAVTLGAGGVTANTLRFLSNGYTVSANTLTLDGSGSGIYVGPGVTTTVNSLITGTTGLAKSGTGVLSLTNANTYTGGTSIQNGSLRLDFAAGGAPASDILTSGTAVTFGHPTNGGGATLDYVGAASVTNSQTLGGITLNPSVGAVISLASGAGGTANLVLGGITRTAGNGSSLRFTLPASGSITTSATNSASGILGAWATVGSGSSQQYATVSGGAIAGYTGGTAITDINSATSATTNYDITTLTTPALTALRTADTIRFNTAGASALTGNFSLAVNGLMNVGGGILSITSTAALTPAVAGGDVVFSGSNQITVAAPIGNNTTAGRFVVNMDPGVILRINTTATNTGGVTVNSGILEIGNVNIGSATASTITINNGATLRTTAGTSAITDTSTVHINEGGTYLFNQDNTETINRLTGAGLLDRTDGSATGRAFTLSSATDAIWGGVIAGSSGTNVIAIVKANTNTVTFTGNNTYTGSTTVSGGRLIVSGTNGRIGSTALITIGDTNGADEILQLGSNADFINGTLDRIVDTAAITITGGAGIDFRGPSVNSGGFTETIGVLTFNSGFPAITLTQAAGGTAQITAASLVRSASGMGLIRGAGLGSTGADTTRLLFSTAPTGNNFIGSSTTAGAENLNIVPWLIGDNSVSGTGTGFLTHDATNGLRLLTPSEYASSISGNATDNISLAGGETFDTADQNFSVNSLRVTAGTTTVNNSVSPARGVLTVGSGAILFTSGGTLTGTSALNFGAVPGNVMVANSAVTTATIANTISGSGGLVFGSFGNEASVIALNGANIFTGGINVASGILRLGNAKALGDGTVLNAVILRTGTTSATGATLQLNGNSTVIQSLSGNQNAIVENGAAGSVVLRIHSLTDQAFSGQVRNGAAGVLNLVKTGASTQTFNGTLAAGNSFTGAAVVSQGPLVLSGNSSGSILGATSISIGGGGILRLTNSSGGNSQGNRLINGTAVTLRGGTFDYDNTADANTSYAEIVGQLAFSAGANTIAVDRAAASRTTALTAASLGRTQGSIVTFTSQDNGTTDNTALGSSTRDRLVFTSVPTLNNGIIGGWAFGGPNGAEFATYLNNGVAAGSGGTGTTAASASVGYVGMATSLTGATVPAYSTNLVVGSWTTSTNVKLDTANATIPNITGATTVNSLNIATNPTTPGNNNITFGAGGALIVDAGGIIYFGSTGTAATLGSTVGVGTITAQGGATAAPDLVVHLPQGTDSLTINANIIDGAGGATGFTKSGLGPVTLAGNNTHTGPTAIVGGQLNIDADARLGTAPGTATAGHLKIYDGTLNITAAGTLNANRLIEVGGASATITQATGLLTYNGTITSPIPTGSNIPDITNVTINGTLAMALAGNTTIGGNLVINGNATASTVAFGGTNNFIGGSFNIGGGGSGTVASTVNATYAVAGGTLSIGTLNPGVTEFTLGYRTAALTGNRLGTLDLTGSENFIVNVNNVRIGESTGDATGDPTARGVLTIGVNSDITANNIFRIGQSPNDNNSGVSSQVIFGSGTNDVRTPQFVVAQQRSTASVTIASGGTLNLNGLTPASALLRIAYSNVNASNASTGTVNLTGGTFRADLGVVTVGYKDNNSSPVVAGTLTIGNSASNYVTATDIILGDQRSSDAAASANGVTGTLNFGGGTLKSNNLVVGNNQATGAGGRTGTGIVNLTGGTLNFGNLVVGNTAATVLTTSASHASVGTVSVGGATLTVNGNLNIGRTVSTVANAAHTATGTVNINNAASAVTVSGNVDLGSVDDTTGTTPSATGTLNLTAGTLSVGGNITRSLLNAATVGQSRGFVNVAGGALDMTSGTIYASTLAFRSGSISNVASGGATLDAGAATSTTSISGLTGDALILRDTDVNFNIALTGATASNVHYENAGAGAGGTISGNISLGSAARTFNVEDIVANANDLTVSGNLSGGAGLTKSGAGTLKLSGANTHVGPVTISAGEVVAGSLQGLGNQNNDYSVAALSFLSTGGFDNAIGGLSGAGTVRNGSATNAVLTIGGGGAASSFSGAVTNGAGGGTLGLTKTGAGTISLTGGSTLDFTGPTVVNGGILNAGVRNTSAITVAGAALNLTDSAAVTLNLGGGGTVLTLSGGAILGFELGAIGDNLILGAGGLGLTSGTITIDLFGIGGITAGTYPLITSASGGLLSTNGSTGTFVLGNQPSGFTYVLNQTDNLVEVTLAAFLGRYWRGDVDGSWSTTTGGTDTNWSSDAATNVDPLTVPGASDSVLFSNSGATGPVINTTLDANFSIKELIFLSSPTGVTNVNIAPGGAFALTISPTIAANEGITLNAGSGTVNISAPVVVGADQTWKVVNAAGTELIISGDLSGTEDVNKTNTGKVTLSGNNSGFTGNLKLTGGTMNLNSATSVGSGSFTIAGGTIDTTASATTLTTNPTQAWNGNFTFAGTQNLTFGTGAITLGTNVTVTTTASTLTQQGDIVGAFSLAKSGAGTLVLAGNGSTYSSGTSLTQGTLAGVVTGASGTPFGSGAVTIDAGTTFALRGDGVGSSGVIAVGNALTLNGSAIVDVDRVSANTGNTVALGALSIGASTLTVNGANSYGLSFTGGTLSGNATIAHTVAPVTISGTLGESGVRTLTKTGAGVLALNGNNTFSGGLEQAGGTVSLGHANGLGSGQYTVTGASTLTPTVDLSAGGTGPVANAVRLEQFLTVTGSQSLTLSGAITNAFGNQTLTNSLTSGNALTLTGLVSLSESAIARTLTIDGAGSTVQSSTSVIQNGGAGASVLVKAGTGTLTLNGTNTFTGGLNLNAGALILGHKNALGTARLQTGGAVTIEANTDLTGVNALPNALTLNTGTTTFQGANNIQFSGTTLNNGGNRTITNNMTGTTPQLTLGAVNLSNDGTSRTLTVRGTGDTIITGVIANGSTSTAGNLTKLDAGTLILTGTNTYAGTTTITTGVLQVGNAGTSGNLGTSTVVNNAILRVNRTNALTMSNGISGSGTFEQVGSGVTSLSGANTYTGTTTISAGTLSIGAATTTGTLNVAGTIINNSVLQFNRTNAAVQGTDFTASAITGTGSVVQAGTSTVTLNVANTYSGNTTISGANGILIAAITDALGDSATSDIIFAGGRRLVLDAGVTISNDVTIGTNSGESGRGMIESSGGSPTLSGNITINNGSASGGHFAGGAGVLNLTGVITSSVPVTQRLGTVTYSGGGTGFTNMSVSGTAVLAATNGLATTATVDIGTSTVGTLDLAGFNQTLVGITKGVNAATIGNSSTTTDSVLTTTGTSIYAGVIQNVVGAGTQKVSLTVNGGSLTLSGANTYTGDTTVTAGTLQLGSGTTTGSLAITSAISVASGATFAVNRSNIVTQGTTFSSAGITGAGNFAQMGTGTTVLNVANNYSGTTTVSAGTLQVGNGTSGSLTGTGAVTVASAATLSGSGSIAGATTINSGGFLTPGVGTPSTSNSSMTFGSSGTALELADGAAMLLSITSSTKIDSGYDFNVADALTYLNTLTSNGTDFSSSAYTTNWMTAESTYDSIKLTAGTFKLGTTAGGTIKLGGNGDTGLYAIGQIFKLLDWVGLSTTNIAGGGSFTTGTDLDLSGLNAGGFVFDTSAFATYGVIVVVPEPSRAILLLFGLLALFIRRRRS
jgi:fibronectin-binding autotransporter adhesin